VKVSLCVIAKNEEQFLPMLLSDIKAQSYPHSGIEVVLVNSNSTDNTPVLMTQFAQDNKDFQNVAILLNCKNSQASSWNVALSYATGDVVVRVDAHGSIPMDFVSNIVSNIQSGEKVVGGGRPNKVLDKTPWAMTLLAAEECMFGGNIAKYRRVQSEKQYLNTIFHGAYCKEVLAKVGGFNENLGRTEDNEFHYRITQAGYKICCCPDIISYQYIRTTLGGMIKQKYSNGLWIGLTTGVCPKCLSYFYFAPLLLVLGFVLSAVLAAVGIAVPIGVLSGVYALFDIFITVNAFIGRRRYPQLLLLPFIFPLLHFSYGAGTLVGLIKMPFWRKTIETAEKRINEIKRHYSDIK